MEDVNISIYRASVVREGSTPASPGFVVSDGQNPVDPSGSGQNHLPVTIAETATGLSITESQVLGGAGTVGQYIRGDGSLADFPESSGGGSSVSYYLNGSVAQGTIGGVAYKELNKVPILGAGTDFTINADGYIASFITDAGDPNLLEIPGGNWNFETYFSASSSGGTPTFYVELYKVNSGGTATLIASNSGFPELIAFGTNIISYFSTLAVPTTALALTDRLAIRYYVTHSGRTITLHTEDNHLCQIVTTFTTGLTALNGLTAQIQNFAVGTSGTDFAISSATATHTFNLPTASATNRGALSSADWTTFNSKTSNLGTVTSVGLSSATSGVTIGSSPVTTSGTITLAIATASGSQNGLLSSTDWTTFNSKQNALTNPVTGTGASGQVAYFTGTSAISSESNLFWDAANDRLGIGNASPTEGLILNNGAFRVTSQALDFSAGTRGISIDTTGGNLGRIYTVTGSGTATDLALGTNNTEQFRIFAAGNTHIGLTPASDNGARLQVSGTTTTMATITSSGTASGLQLTNTSGTASSWIIQSDGGAVAGQAALRFYSLTASAYRMSIDGSGNVGIGTTSPSGAAGLALAMNSGANQCRIALKTSSTGDASGDGLQIGMSGIDAFIEQRENSTLDFATNALTSMRIFNDGNVLIQRGGTFTNNGAKLQVSGTATVSTSLSVNTTNSYGKFQTKVATDANFYLTNYNAGEVGVQFTNDANSLQCKAQFYASQFVFTTGNVGIGETNPTQPLQIGGNGNILVAAGGTFFSSGRLFIRSGTGQNLEFGANNTNSLMVLTSAGNLGINQSSPTSALEIRSNSSNGWLKLSTTSGNPFISSTNNLAFFTVNTNEVLNLQGDGLAVMITGGGFANQTTLDANTRFQGPNNSATAAKCYAWNTYSDQRIKQDINSLNYGLNEIMQLNPVSYNQHDSEVIDGEIILKETYKSTIGLIAQEVYNLIPESVGVGNDSELWGLDYDKIVPVLIKAIQELKQEIDTLKN